MTWCGFKDAHYKIKLLGLYQNEKLCTVDETINKAKRQPTDWQMIYLVRINIQNIQKKKLIQLNTK